MKHLPLVLPTLLFLMLSAASAQVPIDLANTFQQKAFTQVDRTGDDKFRSFFMFAAGGRDFTIRGDGYGEGATGNARATTFRLTLGRPGRLERLYFLEYEGDLILMYEATDQRFGWGYVERFDLKKMRRKWMAPAGAVNIGPGVVEANYLYLTAENMVGKIDLASGKYVWQHDEFQKQYSLQVESFQVPTVTTDRIAFYENGHRKRTIEIEKNTGRILNLPN